MNNLEEVFIPDSCIIIEDHRPSSDFLANWANSYYPNSQLHKFERIDTVTQWINQKFVNTREKSILALVDLGLPDGSGLEVIRLISQKLPNSLIVVITVIEDSNTLFEALELGAQGYILKHDDPIVVSSILNRITLGEPPLSPKVASRIISHFQKLKPKKEIELTTRETETLVLITKGLTVSETASKMGLSPSTVASYIKVIYQKLHVSNRVEATHEAIKRGLI